MVEPQRYFSMSSMIDTMGTHSTHTQQKDIHFVASINSHYSSRFVGGGHMRAECASLVRYLVGSEQTMTCGDDLRTKRNTPERIDHCGVQ